MALQDKDRIFTNVYGFQPWNLAAARARGDWDNTKALLEKGRDAIIQDIKDSGPVSYTHLDVYKRQECDGSRSEPAALVEFRCVPEEGHRQQRQHHAEHEG